MPTDLSLRCSCGQVRAVIHDLSPAEANRNICCCDGCQRYAHQLERADEILDRFGGTDVFQVSPRSVEIIEGEAHLACWRMTSKGALRWLASCCNTPIAHTLPSHNMPFLAINHLCVDRTAFTGSLESYVGPVRATVNGRFSKEEARQQKATVGALLKMMWHYMPLFFKWKMRGDHKHSPFFDGQTGQPIRQPQLTEAPTQTRSLPLVTKKAGCG